MSLLPPTEAGRLYPRYVKKAGLLAVGSRIRRPWPFGVTLDGGMIFDLDERRVLANFELHEMRSMWKRERIEDEAPTIAPPGDLVFTPETVAIGSFSRPVEARLNTATGRLGIRFSALRPDRAVALSPTCIAFLRDDLLLGFDVRDIVESSGA